MQLEKQSNPSKEKSGQVDSDEIKTLIDTALGKEKADMVVTNADLVNVYSGELLKGWSVAVKGDKIAYVGEDAEHTIGSDTMVIDATGKVLAPGFIDPHAHTLSLSNIDEFLKYAMRGGTTTIISETKEFVIPLGSRGVWEYLKAIEDQPIKLFVTVGPTVSINPSIQSEDIRPDELKRLLKQKNVVGLGETPWQFITDEDENLIQLYAETLNSGKMIQGHSPGARGEKLAAYVAAGVASCHESTTAEEALERLRLGLHAMVREGAVRRDLEAVSKIKDESIDFRRLVLCIDGITSEHLINHGYMEFVVQKAIDLGFDPIVAIQMATLNAAEHFSLDNVLGGIAPGKYADMVILPDLRNIKAEMVISNGQIIAQEGQILVTPRKHVYSKTVMKSVHVPRKLKPADFQVRVENENTPVTVRVMNLVTDLISREEQIDMTPKDGLLESDVEKDILKITYIDRTKHPGKMFTGFVKGYGMKKGAFASSATWSISGIVVVGVNDEDMAWAVNRVIAMQGGDAIYNDGELLAELPLSIAGYVSELPIEEISRKFEQVRHTAQDLGVPHENPRLTMDILTTNIVPFLRISESGYMDIRKGEMLDLIV